MTSNDTIDVLNGPNLNPLGTRQPEIYGRQTLADLETLCREETTAAGLELVFFQSNAEHERPLSAWRPDMTTEGRTDGLRATPGGGLSGEVDVPGDKSMSHRALILGAMADGVTTIQGLLESDDVLRTVEAVRAFGADVRRTDDGSWSVEGGPWRSPSHEIDCGNSGTSARLLMGAAASFPIEATFTGDQSLQRRPMRRIIEPLREMGVVIDGGPQLPITVRGGGLTGISYFSPRASAQVKSAILLAGLTSRSNVEVIEPVPTRDHTEKMLQQFGCEVLVSDRAQGRCVTLGRDRSLHGCDVFIAGDPSSAAFPIVAALVTPNSKVIVKDVLDEPLRSGLLVTLVEMGADLRISNRRTVAGVTMMDVTARTSSLHGVEVPAARAPTMIDEYPILAIAAAFASGTTSMPGLGELRVKESDRLAGIERGLRACGVRVAQVGDGLAIEGCGGPPLGGASIEADGDHRIAMAFLVLGLGAAAPVTANSAAMIGTSFPGFADLLRRLGPEIEPC